MAVRLIFRGFLTFVLACHNPVETPPEPICQSDKRIKGGSHFPAFYFRSCPWLIPTLDAKSSCNKLPRKARTLAPIAFRSRLDVRLSDIFVAFQIYSY